MPSFTYWMIALSRSPTPSLARASGGDQGGPGKVEQATSGSLAATLMGLVSALQREP